MSALVDALQKGQVTGDCTLAAVLDGPEAGSRMLLRGGRPVWQTHSSGVLQRSLSRLQECTATGFLELDGTRVFVERFGAVPQIVVCVALIACGMWLVRGPKNKKGKQPAEEEPEDFHAYTAAPQAEDAEDPADAATHVAMPELSALLGEPVTDAEQNETPAEDDDDRAE